MKKSCKLNFLLQCSQNFSEWVTFSPAILISKDSSKVAETEQKGGSNTIWILNQASFDLINEFINEMNHI